MEIKIDANGLVWGGKNLRDAPKPEQIKICEIFILSFCHERQTINRNEDSYGYKNRTEEWAQFINKYYGSPILESYVSNGAFIQAAKNLGYIPYPCEYGRSPNAYFNMGFRFLNEMDWYALRVKYGAS